MTINMPQAFLKMPCRLTETMAISAARIAHHVTGKEKFQRALEDLVPLRALQAEGGGEVEESRLVDALARRALALEDLRHGTVDLLHHQLPDLRLRHLDLEAGDHAAADSLPSTPLSMSASASTGEMPAFYSLSESMPSRRRQAARIATTSACAVGSWVPSTRFQPPCSVTYFYAFPRRNQSFQCPFTLVPSERISGRNG